jgi:hypothetical protein
MCCLTSWATISCGTERPAISWYVMIHRPFSAHVPWLPAAWREAWLAATRTSLRQCRRYRMLWSSGGVGVNTVGTGSFYCKCKGSKGDGACDAAIVSLRSGAGFVRALWHRPLGTFKWFWGTLESLPGVTVKQIVKGLNDANSREHKRLQHEIKCASSRSVKPTGSHECDRTQTCFTCIWQGI